MAPHHVWFTADPHFGHANFTKEGKHPFDKRRPFNTVKQMDDFLVKSWNNTVKPEDEVYVVGDFCLDGLPKTSEYFRRLNGRIYVIPGSHDQRWVEPYRKAKQEHDGLRQALNLGNPALAGSKLPTIPLSANGVPVMVLPELVTLRLPQYKVDGHTLTLTMCHYQMASWEQSHHGTLHIFGHHHGQRKPIGRSMDVGVDTSPGYRPYGLAEIVQALLAKPVHHKYDLEVE